MNNKITIVVDVPNELDQASLEQEIYYLLIDYVEDKAKNPSAWQIEINGEVYK